MKHPKRVNMQGASVGIMALLLVACGSAASPAPSVTSTPIIVAATASATDIPASPVPAPTAIPTLMPNPSATPNLKAIAAKITGPTAARIQSNTLLNSPPLEWDNLRGKVVMIEFWTYG